MACGQKITTAVKRESETSFGQNARGAEHPSSLLVTSLLGLTVSLTAGIDPI